MKKTLSVEEWELYTKKLISKFYHEKPICTQLIPSKDKPSSLILSKVITVLILNDEDPSAVAKIKKDKIRMAGKIELFHMGEKKMSMDTTYGFKPLEGMNGVFHHPATDTGGITAYRQPLGEKPDFLLKKHCIIGDSLQDRKALYTKWLELSKKKRFFGNVFPLFDKWLISCQNFAEKNGYDNARINFVRLPDMHRVIVSRSDVEKDFGAYYVKVYGNPKFSAKITKDGEGEELFAAITEKYVNMDIRRRNILNEYTTYDGYKKKYVPKRKI